MFDSGVKPELAMGRVHPWVGLGWVGLGRDFEISDGSGWVGSKTMGHLAQSVSIDDVYKLNISYQCIKK